MPLKQEKEKIQNATNAKVQDVTIANLYLQVTTYRGQREGRKGTNKSKGDLLGQSKGLTGAKGLLIGEKRSSKEKTAA